jgi:hypothetical protein
MKFNIIITAISFTAFGLLQLQEVPPAVRMAGITVAYLPSTASAGLCFFYFQKIPDSRYSLLTTAAKSVVGYHILMSTGFYIREFAMAFFSSTMKESLEMSPNITCHYDLTLLLPPLGTAAIAQLQVLRYIMTIMPQTFLELDHSLLAYPLVASVPITTGAVMFLIYYLSGSLCDRFGVRMLIHTLNLNVDVDNMLFAVPDPKAVFFSISVLIEGLIRIYKSWETIKGALKSVTKCCVNNDIVPVETAVPLVPVETAKPLVPVLPTAPEVSVRGQVPEESVESTDDIVHAVPVVHAVPEVSVRGFFKQDSSQNTGADTSNQQQITRQYDSDVIANSPIIVTAFIFLLICAFFSLTSSVTFFINILRNFYLWIVPIIWMTKQEIKTFSKLKYNQLRARFGYF